MVIEEENKNIEQLIRDLAKKLLEEKEVDVILGYTKGTIPLSSLPIVIDKVEDVDKLIWNNLCYINLAKYLVPRIPTLINEEGQKLKVGIVSKGCVGRALIHLSVEHQIDLENIKIIGIPCNGIINRKKIEDKIGEKEIFEISVSGDNIIVKGEDFEKKLPFNEYMNELCKTCQVKSPPNIEGICVGECLENPIIEDDFSDIADFDSKTPEEKWEYIKNLLDTCTRCYACREVCPMCYCNLCFVDQNQPVWFGKTTAYSDIFTFHLIRAMHMAGRCVGCGACSSVCPIGIDLNLINRSLEKIAKERFNFTSGIDPETLPPMMAFDIEDKQEFMMEED
ncbi:MAG: 4Fe-4S binding protein [Promethearchaeota archaeon]